MTQHLLYLHVQSFWFYWGNHLLSMLPVNSINTLRNSSDKDIPCSTGCGWLWGQRSVMAPRAYGKSSHKAEMGAHIKALGNLCSTNLVASQGIPHCGFMLHCLDLGWAHLGKWLLLYWSTSSAAGTHLGKLDSSLCLGQLAVLIESPAHDAQFHSWYQETSQRNLGKMNPG